MSDLKCLEELPPGPALIPEGLRQTQNGHDDINKGSRKGKGVRFKLGAPDHPVEPSCSEEDVELCVISWNIHNENPYEFRKEFLDLGAHIWIIQEGNKAFENEKKQLGYRWFTKERNDKQLMIGIIPSIKGRRRLELETPNSLVIEIYLGNRQILIGNIHQTEFKGEYRILLEKLQDSLAVCGADLNSKPQKELNRFNIISDLITRKRKNSKIEWKNKKSEIGSKIDFIFINKGISNHQKIQTKFQFKNDQQISDHKPIAMRIVIKRNDSMRYPVIDSKEARSKFCEWKAKEKCWKLKKEFENIDIQNLITVSKELKPKDNLIKFRSPKYQDWNEKFQQKIQTMERCEKGNYHKFIQHTTQIRAEKEGGIVNIMEKDGQIITCYKQIQHECIEKMKRISGCLQEGEERPWKNQRKITKDMIDEGIYESMKFDEILKMEGEYFEWFNRAVSYDFIHLTTVRLVMRNHLLRNGDIDWNLLDLDIWQTNEYCMAQRLIPLNKVAPKIASVDDVRPIMVQSHLVKFMEWSCMKALKEINNLRIDPCQVGFTSKLGTQVHLSKIISRMKSKGEGKNFTFFDLSDAYNTIDREVLYNIMTLENMLIDQKRLDFLFNVYDQLYIYDPITKEKVRFKNGVQQGSALSPFFFNIFFEKTIEFTKIRIREISEGLPKRQKRIKRWLNEIELLAYADDVVIYSRKEVAKYCAEAFIEISSRFGLKVNLKKTKYLCNKINPDLKEKQIQKAETFRYLGTWLSVRGGLKDQLRRTRKIVTLKSQKLSMLRRLIPFRSITKLWVVYVLPHIRYHNLAIWKQKKCMIKQWQLIKRNLFRRVLGLNKSFPKNIIDGLIGRLEYDVKEDGYIQRQLKIALFRKHLFDYYSEGLIWYQVTQLYNYFLWNQFQHLRVEIFDLEHERADEYGDFAGRFFEENGDYNIGKSILNKEFDSMEAMEKVVGWDEEDRIARGVQTQIIRRIPGYKFFEPFKHGWRKCKSHDKNMTVKHIMVEHLMNEPGNWLKKLERIQEYILDTAKPFSSKIQKAMSELATKLAKRIKDLIASDCEPYVKKKNNPVQ